VEILLSDKIDKDLLGVFANTFHLSNYEFTKKTAPEKKEEDKTNGEDERLKKFTKKISHITFSHPQMTEVEKTHDYKFWVESARATELARDLANTRGSVATPEYMEEQAKKVLANQKYGVKDFRVVKGQELVN